MLAETEKLSELIGVIYDTALDPSRWTEALEKTAVFMGATGSTFGVHDAATKEANALYLYGGDPKLLDSYYETSVKLNPGVVPVSLYYEPGDIFTMSTLIPYDELRRSRLFREWMQPQGWGDFTHCVVEKDGARFSHFGVAHPEKDSPADSRARALLGLLVPHVLRAVEISKTLRLQRVEADRLAASLDALSAAVFLVDGDGGCVYANPSGLALLGDGALLVEVDGVLRPTDKTAAGYLHDAIVSCSAADAALAGQPVAIPLGARAGVTWLAHVISLRHGARLAAGRRFDATAAIFVHGAAARRPTLVQAVTRQFNLTAGEARVLFTLLQAEGIAQTAEVLGISEETVKTHLGRVFGKTGTTGQADLFKLLLGFTNPVVG